MNRFTRLIACSVLVSAPPSGVCPGQLRANAAGWHDESGTNAGASGTGPARALK